MRKLYILFIFYIAFFVAKDSCFAATVGNPLDLDVPRTSAVLRQQLIDQTLDEHEQALKIKTALDLEFIFDKNLHASYEMQGIELEGQWHMVKLGATIFNRIEPYIKLGTSDLEVRWKQGTEDIEVDADSGFAWGAGVKGKILELGGIRLTGDIQYRATEADVGDISRGNTTVTDSGADFKIDEWQIALVLSKKFELPLKWQSLYIVPYTGFTFSDSNVDVKFQDPTNPTGDFSLFDACNEDKYGFLIGCDIMPDLTSSFSYSIELRLINELALTLGGALKF